MSSSRPVTAEEAAELLDVPASLIAVWKARRRVMPVGLLRGRGRRVPVYDLEDLRPLAERHHELAARRKDQT